MRYEVDSSGVSVLLLDSISEILPEDADKIVVAGSHCSQNVPRYALSVPLRAAVFNDAGLGKDNAGIASFGTLSDNGLAAVAVSHDSARIGDARDAFENGVISAANDLARRLGAEPGLAVADFIALVDAER
jgi:hypothetical protein